MKSGRWSEEWGGYRIEELWQRYHCFNTTFARAAYEQLKAAMDPFLYDSDPEAEKKPNALCDYFTVGGRFWGAFPVRESCKEVVIGKKNDLSGTMEGLCGQGISTFVISRGKPVVRKEGNGLPEGYIRVSAARKKDIDWALLRELTKSEEEPYPVLTSAYALIDHGEMKFYVDEETHEDWVARVNAFMDAQPEDAVIAVLDGGEL